MARSPLLNAHFEQGWRLSLQKRTKPLDWAPGQREALIEQAVNAGKVTTCPDGFAEGMLVFNHGSNFRSSSHTGIKKSGAI